MTDAASIPLFYRIYFRYADLALAIWGAYMDFFTPDVVYNAFVPTALAPRNPLHDFLTQQLGGALLMCAFMDLVLLRYTTDVNIWKIWEAALLCYDAALSYSIYYALMQQGRLSLGALRLEDWGSIVITAQAALVRLLFVFGVGLKKGKGAKTH